MYQPTIYELTKYGPPMRMDTTFAWFWAYERALTAAIGSEIDDENWEEEMAKGTYKPPITFFGSNDFHHLSLAHVRRFRTPFNFVRVWMCLLYASDNELR